MLRTFHFIGQIEQLQEGVWPGGQIQWILWAAIAVTVESTSAREGPADRSRDAAKMQLRSRQPAIVPGELGKDDIRRIREGTIVTDQSGVFREDGDGATFVADSGWSFGALPNLNLERVIRLIKSTEEPGSVRWSVSGEVTEFNGRNFLLISRAVYKAATPPPVPSRVDKP